MIGRSLVKKRAEKNVTPVVIEVVPRVRGGSLLRNDSLKSSLSYQYQLNLRNPGEGNVLGCQQLNWNVRAASSGRQ